MTTIGIRCSSTLIYYSIIRTTDNTFEFINQELIIPKSFDIPNKLKYVRKTMLDIFREYHIEKAGIRITEPTAMSPDKFRAMLEAVIQELIASSNATFYFTGIIASISSRLGLANDGTLKSIIAGKQKFKEIDTWLTIKEEYRECILVGFATLNA